ncbi:MAG: hypothetical protein R3E42_19565 [Burkholderiaceae bacterium]
MTDTAVDRLLPWHLPSHWEAVDFISDLHLQASDMATFERWRSFMESPPIKHADALVILGDFFEVWAGDDLLNSELGGESSGFARQCVAILRAHSATRPVYFMHSNRDFCWVRLAWRRRVRLSCAIRPWWSGTEQGAC